VDGQILDPEVQQFISANTTADVSQLALTKNPFPAIGFKEILSQISARSKAKDKLPTWFKTPSIYYPPKISVEQSSSEKTARYKATLVGGQNLFDLTGGFGVDDLYFSKAIPSVIHCELNAQLSAIVAHNFEVLGIQNVKCKTGDSTEWLKVLGRKFDWLYIDPSRRNDTKGKVFLLKDCLPNVPSLLDFYLSFSDNILVKTAPILDITAGLGELKSVKAIHIVAVENEVKELLWIISNKYEGNVEIVTVNLVGDNAQHFSFAFGSRKPAVSYGLPATYLYEPNAAIMKSGGFEHIGAAYQLDKLHQHSHLYTSGELRNDFPGRIFRIDNSAAYTKNNMKEFVAGSKANVSVRNFPETVETLRKKWKITDGGNVYCFFTTNISNDKIVLLCSKI
jgi:hypothetical protein